MTLAELLPTVEKLTAADKLKLIRILAEQLDESEDVSPLVAGHEYGLHTPYPAFGVGRELIRALQDDETDRR